MLGGDPLDGEGDDLLRLALGVAARRLADLANPVGGVGLRLLFHAADQFALGVLRRHAGQLLEPAPLVGDQLLEFALAIDHGLLAAAEVAHPAAEVLVALIERVELAVELGLPLLDAPLFAFHLFAAAAGLELERLAELDQLFLARDDGALAQVFRFTLGVVHHALGHFLRRRLRIRLAPEFGGPAEAPPYKEKRRRRGNESAERGVERGQIHVGSILHRGMGTAETGITTTRRVRSLLLSRPGADEGHQAGRANS